MSKKQQSRRYNAVSVYFPPMLLEEIDRDRLRPFEAGDVTRSTFVVNALYDWYARKGKKIGRTTPSQRAGSKPAQSVRPKAKKSPVVESNVPTLYPDPKPGAKGGGAGGAT